MIIAKAHVSFDHDNWQFFLFTNQKELHFPYHSQVRAPGRERLPNRPKLDNKFSNTQVNGTMML